MSESIVEVLLWVGDRSLVIQSGCRSVKRALRARRQKLHPASLPSEDLLENVAQECWIASKYP